MNIFSHHYHHKYRLRFPRHHKKIFLADAALIAAILALGIIAILYLVFKPTSQYLSFSITPNQQKIIAGSMYDWEVRAANTSKKPVHDISISFIFPESFKAQTDAMPYDGPITASRAPDAEQTRIWRIDSLPALGALSKNMRGAILSRPGENVKIIARVEGAAYDNQQFSEIHILAVRATDPALTASLETPRSARVGETFPLILTYSNQSSAVVANAAFRFEFPAGFIIYNKPSAWNNQTITVPRIEPGERGTFVLHGAVRADTPIPQISVALNTAAEIFGRRVEQENALQSFEILPTGIKISIKNQEPYAEPGAPLNLILSFTHEGAEKFTNVSVCVSLDEQMIDAQSVKGALGRIIGGAYCFTPDTYPELAEISNGFRHEWPITLTVRNAPYNLAVEQSRNAVLAFIPRATVRLVRGIVREGAQSTELSLWGNELRVPLTTTFTLTAMGRYFTNEGDQLGRGPLPPRAGQTTKYWIAWSLRSSANAVQNVVLRAALAPGAQWIGKSSVTAGKHMQYDASAREIIWGNKSLAPDGDGCACAEGGFEISFIPSAGDVGKEPLLLTRIRAESFDVWTGARVSASAPDISTNLTNDPLALGKGRVEK